MSVNRNQRVKNMFPAPKTTAIVVDDPIAPVTPNTHTPLKENQIEDIPLEIIEVEIDEIGTNDPIQDSKIILDSPVASDSKPPTKNKREKKVVDKATPPQDKVMNKTKNPKAIKFEGPNVHLGCRVSNEMKDSIEDMAKDFAYLARKEYGIKIKDSCSSIQRAFLLLGMSCFTENVRHKVLKGYDHESEMEDEVLQQLIALMRIHKVEIDDMDF